MAAENPNQIEAFLEGTLSESEKLIFEKRLQQDPEFKALVEDYQQAVWMLKVQRHLDLRAEVDAITNANEITPFRETIPLDPQPEFSVHWIRWAAVFIILCITSFLYFFMCQRYSNIGLTEQYFDPYTSITNFDTTFLEDNFNEGLTHYEQRRYDSAIAYFESISAEKIHYQAAQLYLASSYLAIGTPAKAEKILKPLHDRKVYESVVNWYLGLAKLGRSDVMGARQLFQEVQADSSDRIYQEKAGRILDQLNHKIRSLPGIP